MTIIVLLLELTYYALKVGFFLVSDYQFSGLCTDIYKYQSQQLVGKVLFAHFYSELQNII